MSKKWCSEQPLACTQRNADCFESHVASNRTGTSRTASNIHSGEAPEHRERHRTCRLSPPRKIRNGAGGRTMCFLYKSGVYGTDATVGCLGAPPERFTAGILGMAGAGGGGSTGSTESGGPEGCGSSADSNHDKTSSIVIKKNRILLGPGYPDLKPDHIDTSMIQSARNYSSITRQPTRSSNQCETHHSDT